MRRAIQKQIEYHFDEEIINAHSEEGDLLKVDYKNGDSELKISVVKGGFLSMPEGANEALKEDLPTEEPASDEDDK